MAVRGLTDVSYKRTTGVSARWEVVCSQKYMQKRLAIETLNQTIEMWSNVHFNYILIVIDHNNCSRTRHTYNSICVPCVLTNHNAYTLQTNELNQPANQSINQSDIAYRALPTVQIIPLSHTSLKPFSTAGMKGLGMLMPIMPSSNSTPAMLSPVRGTSLPMIRPYWPDPPVCFLWR